MSRPRITGEDLFRSLSPEDFAALDTPESREEMRKALERILEETSQQVLAHFPPTMLPMPRWP